MAEHLSEQEIPAVGPLDFRGIVDEPLPSPRWAASRARSARNLAWWEHSLMLLGLLIGMVLVDVRIKDHFVYSLTIPPGVTRAFSYVGIVCGSGVLTQPRGHELVFSRVELGIFDQDLVAIQGVASHESAVALGWIWRMTVYECCMLLFGAVGRGFWLLIGKAEAFRRTC
jgi:hypothetical protein